jgi:hypothetical protein
VMDNPELSLSNKESATTIPDMGVGYKLLVSEAGGISN